MQCPCASGNQFKACCQLLIVQQKIAETPEQLMRSRYSAYAMKSFDYIFDTYSEEAKKMLSTETIKSTAENCTWVNLVVHHSSLNQDKAHGVVAFSAYYIENRTLYVMQEKSNFIQEKASWRYHDGEMIEHVQLNKVKRNDKCPCQSDKKFKVCCAALLS